VDSQRLKITLASQALARGGAPEANPLKSLNNLVHLDEQIVLSREKYRLPSGESWAIKII
jgi:hypothetical protein